MRFLSLVLIMGLTFVIIGCQSNGGSSAAEAATRSPARAEEVQPLGEGDRAPDAELRRPDGQSVRASQLFAQGPSVVIFYRGGWCPYCNVHLGEVATAERALAELGYQVLAISPDRPEALSASVEEHGYSCQLLSDSNMTLARRFGIAFHVDDATVERYKGFGIDLEASSGRAHHELPVPAVYIVGTDGRIRFAHWDPDYKSRLDTESLLSAAKRVAGR